MLISNCYIRMSLCAVTGTDAPISTKKLLKALASSAASSHNASISNPPMRFDILSSFNFASKA